MRTANGHLAAGRVLRDHERLRAVADRHARRTTRHQDEHPTPHATEADDRRGVRPTPRRWQALRARPGSPGRDVASAKPPRSRRRLDVVLLRAGTTSTTLAGCVVATSATSIERGPDTVRGPDVAVRRAGERDSDLSQDDWVEGGPDLAVEIRSPGDRRGEIGERVADYLRAGTPLVWIVDPAKRNVLVRSPAPSTGCSVPMRCSTAGTCCPGSPYGSRNCSRTWTRVTARRRERATSAVSRRPIGRRPLRRVKPVPASRRDRR